MTTVSKTMTFSGVRITASKAGGAVGGALLCGVVAVAVLAFGTHLLGSAAGGLAAANAAVESAIGVAFGTAVLVLIGAVTGLGVWWIASTPRRRREAGEVAEVRARQAVAGQRARRSVAASSARELPAAAPIQAQAVRVDELEGVRDR